MTMNLGAAMEGERTVTCEANFYDGEEELYPT